MFHSFFIDFKGTFPKALLEMICYLNRYLMMGLLFPARLWPQSDEDGRSFLPLGQKLKTFLRNESLACFLPQSAFLPILFNL